MFADGTLTVGKESFNNLGLTGVSPFNGNTSIISGPNISVEEIGVKGTIIYNETAGVSCSVGQLMSFDLSTSKWKLADADDISATKILGIALNAASADDDLALLIEGIMVTGEFNGTINEGNVLYVSTTAGDFTFTAPTAAGDYVRGVGWCIKSASASKITVFFQPDCTWLEL